MDLNAYERLKQLREQISGQEKKIRDKKARRARLYSLLTSGTAPITGEPGGGHHGPDEKLVNLAAMDEEIRDDVDALAGLQREAAALCCRAGEGPMQRVLTLRYVDALGWGQIRRKMHYSERGIFYLHERAVRAVEESLQ